MQFEVRLKILEKTTGGLYQFKWNGNVMRTKYESATLLIEAEDEEDLVNVITDLSDKTLSIIDVSLFSQEDRDSIELTAELAGNVVIPMEFIRELETNGIIIGNN